MDPILIVGLGNPGTEYDGTRHNLGFAVIDEIAARLDVRIRTSGNALVGTAEVGGRAVVLAKPLTYMNNSGEAVMELLEAHQTTIGNLLVVADDIALPLGTLRIRKKGSDGGHNGLHSILYHLGSNAFARIRCGIRQEQMPPKERMADFVLSVFERSERARVEQMTQRAADAALVCVRSGIARAMNEFNGEATPDQQAESIRK